MTRSSRLPGFYRRPLAERRALLVEHGSLGERDSGVLDSGGLDPSTADSLIENVIGVHALPFALALNFQVNGRDVLVPMCIEEASVVAAASHAAKLVRAGGGFRVERTPPLMIGQVQLCDVPDPAAASAAILAHRDQILGVANAVDPYLCSLGGGARDLELRSLACRAAPHADSGWPAVSGAGELDSVASAGEPAQVTTGDALVGCDSGGCRGRLLIVHLLVDCRDAMGANLVNSMAEALAPLLASLSGGRPLLRILSNLADRRLVRARARVPLQALALADRRTPGGDAAAGPAAVAGATDGGDATADAPDAARVRDGILAASRFAELDPYRAATHNKGIMNGVDAVALACGQDFRGLEAGAHAYAARGGRYRPLSLWRRDAAGDLVGELEMPMAIGTVGGITRSHPGVALALRLSGAPSAGELGEIVAAAGLASNLSALRALASEGIQRGHMALHARQLAVAAGAQGAQVGRVADELCRLGEISLPRASEVLCRLAGGSGEEGGCKTGEEGG